MVHQRLNPARVCPRVRQAHRAAGTTNQQAAPSECSTEKNSVLQGRSIITATYCKQSAYRATLAILLLQTRLPALSAFGNLALRP